MDEQWKNPMQPNNFRFSCLLSGGVARQIKENGWLRAFKNTKMKKKKNPVPPCRVCGFVELVRRMHISVSVHTHSLGHESAEIFIHQETHIVTRSEIQTSRTVAKGKYLCFFTLCIYVCCWSLASAGDQICSGGTKGSFTVYNFFIYPLSLEFLYLNIYCLFSCLLLRSSIAEC